jgi:hypothetical protein
MTGVRPNITDAGDPSESLINGLAGGLSIASRNRRRTGCRFATERGHDIDELDDTGAALAALVFGSERLVLVETPGYRGLAQSLVLAQLRGEHDLARRAQGVAASGEAKVERDGLTA